MPFQRQFKDGTFVAILNVPKGAGGNGHNTLLVRNPIFCNIGLT